MSLNISSVYGRWKGLSSGGRIHVLVACACTVLTVVMLATGEFGITVAQHRESLAEYDWPELKAIATYIAEAETEEDAVDIARSYGLVDGRGKPYSSSKTIVLYDGTQAEVRLAGVRTTKKSSGQSSGLTFALYVPGSSQPMNSEATNEGGWGACGVRGWASGVLWKNLPMQMRDYAARIDTGVEDGDRLFLPSVREWKDLKLDKNGLYWTRTPVDGDDVCFCAMNSEQEIVAHQADQPLDIVLIFCY